MPVVTLRSTGGMEEPVEQGADPRGAKVDPPIHGHAHFRSAGG